jgi:hypothetical protein
VREIQLGDLNSDDEAVTAKRGESKREVGPCCCTVKQIDVRRQSQTKLPVSLGAMEEEKYYT